MEGKVARSVGIMNKIKQTFPQSVMLLLCIALLHPLLNLLYGIIIATYHTYIQKLTSLQNRAIRAVVDAHLRDSVNPYYLGLPYVLFLEDTSPFLMKNNLFSKDVKKITNVLLFGILNR